MVKVVAKLPTLMARIQYPTEKGGCWNWCGYVGKTGYGYMAVRPHGTRTAHRLVYETLVGEIPEGLQLDHLCMNKRCVKPDHLEPVTRSENMYRAPLKSRMKTHCVNGHEYTAKNTLLRKDRARGTQRDCRQCAKARITKFRERKQYED